MSSHHSDQMSQRSQVSRVALWMTISKVLSESVSQWQGHLLSCSGQLRRTLPEAQRTQNILGQNTKLMSCFFPFRFLSQFSLIYIKIHKPLHFAWLFHILLLLVKHMYICAKSTKRWKHMNAPSFPRVTNMSKEGQCIGNILAKYLLHQVWTNSQWLSISI